MDRLESMRIFATVAEAASFAGAARQLSISPPAVTRAIAALEERLGVRLLSRTTRLVRVTEAGARYLEDCRRILAEVAEADESAAGLNTEPRGQLHVTAPVLFGRIFVLPAVTAYLERYPQVSVNALFLDRVVNLLDEGLDVAIRIGELPDSSLQAIEVGQVRRVVCAAPEYLKRHGRPAVPEELPRHSVILARGVTPALEWKFLRDGSLRPVRVAPRLSVNTNDSAVAAAVAGTGLTRLLSYQVAPQLASGELEIVLAEFEPPPLPIHVVHREGRRASAKVRAFVDLIVEQLRADKALNWHAPEGTSGNVR